jgi:hypothetical protein
MSHVTDDPTYDPLDDEMRSALAALPRERIGSAALESRVVQLLRGAGLIQPRGQIYAVRALRVAAAAAAATLLFTAGIAVGRKTAEARQIGVHTLADSASLALLEHRTGTEFVNTLERIPTEADASDPRALAQGREVARSTLRAAARQVARVAPNDPVAAMILESTRADAVASNASLVWF